MREQNNISSKNANKPLLLRFGVILRNTWCTYRGLFHTTHGVRIGDYSTQHMVYV